MEFCHSEKVGTLGTNPCEVRLNEPPKAKFFTPRSISYRIETIDGTAEAEKDYIPVKQVMVFEKEETHKYFDIEIIDDNDWEPDEVDKCFAYVQFALNMAMCFILNVDIIVTSVRNYVKLQIMNLFSSKNKL